MRYLFRRFKERIESRKAELAIEFYSYIADLITDERVLSLDRYVQHYGYTRLTHSLDVALYSFLITKLFGWDCRSAARGGLLHDLFYYDWRDQDYVCTGKNHATEHPKIALENAKELTSLNKIEEDIILKHMWLITIRPPRYKESFVVTFVDKYCALKEFCLGVFSKKQPRRFFARSIAN